MLDINKHKFFLVSVLKDIYSDTLLATSLGFKGGTAQMLFYNLPRFSVDLDFNLLKKEKSNEVFNSLRKVLLKYGKIRDEAEKHFGLILVLDYGANERNLKVEISNRIYPDNYEVKNYLGIPVMVMMKSDMFSHKLCALLDRKQLTNRDIFDIYFYMKERTPINKTIIEERMNKNLEEYLDLCIWRLKKINPAYLLNGLGELLDQDLKTFVKNNLKTEVIQLLNIYREFPILFTP